MKHLPFTNHRRRRYANHARTPITNAILLPANLLTQKAQYTRLANTLPTGSILILTPPPVFSKQRKTLAAVAQLLQSAGHLVTTLPHHNLTAI
jgi:hypothetical protein